MRILQFVIILFTSLLSISISAQKEGDKWVIGYYGFGNHNYSVMHLDFRGPSLAIEWHFDENMQIDGTAANICDTNGDALLWTNGMEIFGKHGIRVADAIADDGNDTIGYWNYWYDSDYGAFGFPEHCGALILPFPGRENQFSVMYHSAEIHPDSYFQITRYLEARVRMNVDTTFTVLYQDSLIGPYLKWYTGTIVAARHANGRDWWILTFEADSPHYFSHLLDPSGLRLDHEGNIDISVKEGLGQAAFSSQGNYLARMDAISKEEGQNITLYSFDRCQGDLLRLETLHTSVGTFTGVAFSPSERYMYADDNTHLWQWDLWSQNIAASQTLVDTFDGFVQPGWFVMRFGPMMTAPDGRIYIVPPAASSEFMHVIERPDLPANECRFLQHAVNLKVPNGRSAPNIPNFRLGPVDGSLCDTLGKDNHPVARWRYEEDQPGYWQSIRFTDLSFYDPEVWHWDFDDGSTSEETSPMHTFEPGLYQVCLTVSNAYDTDSLCQWIEILTTSTEEEKLDTIQDLSISPNPFNDALVIKSKSGVIRPVHLQLYNTNGQILLDQSYVPVPVSIYLPSLSSGLYLCRIKERDGNENVFKIMKN